MFSGIVKEIGEVSSVDNSTLGITSAGFSRGTTSLGDSIAISGGCLTVARLEGETAFFDLATETRRCTTLGLLKKGDRVNIEPALRLGDALDGHLVSGHIDAVGEVLDRREEENTIQFRISLPAEIDDLIAPKGSITVDGISLTVGEVGPESFSVFIVPFTSTQTTCQYWKKGTRVNLEADCIARYVKRISEVYEAR